MKTIVLKFGGTSLADADQFRKVRAIIEKDPARRFVVASAPGKRSADDTKVTDLLYRCFDLAFSGSDFAAVLRKVDNRFFDIISDLSIDFDLASEIEVIRTHLKTAPQRDYMASRGEYLNSRILAAYLGWDFVDPARCVRFDDYGVLDLFKNYHVPFEQCLTGIDTVSVIVRSDLLAPAREKILRDIKEKLTPDVLYVEDKLSMVTIVGEAAGPSPGLIGRILSAVAAAGVNLSTVNQGAGALNLIIGVGEDDYEKTINAIYQIL